MLFSWDATIKSGDFHTWVNKYVVTTAKYAQVESMIRTCWVERRQTFFLSSAEGFSMLFTKPREAFPLHAKHSSISSLIWRSKTVTGKSWYSLMQTYFRCLLIDKASLKSHLEVVWQESFLLRMCFMHARNRTVVPPGFVFMCSMVNQEDL